MILSIIKCLCAVLAPLILIFLFIQYKLLKLKYSRVTVDDLADYNDL